MVALMIFGLISFKGMGIGQMPDFDFPVLSVSITWEGAAPEVMETDVVDVIEDSVMGIEGLKDISSTSVQGSANINLEFELGRDLDAAMQEVQSKLAAARYRLPDEIDPPIINKINPEDQPIMWISVGTTRSLKDLMDYVERQLKDQFKTVPGVGEVFLGGYVDQNLRIWINISKLKAYELTVDDIIQAIQKEHVEMPAGKLETPTTESNVRVMGEAKTVEEFKKIMINYRGGQPMYRPIPLKEVATIEDGLADVRRMFRTLGKTSVGLGIKKIRGTNSVTIAERVWKRIDEIKKTLPKDFDLGVNFDSTRFIRDSVEELVFSLILASLLTSLVCWFFLGSWSSTMNILLAIPTSLLGTFIVLKFSNFTLNTFTLLGLTLAIGIVVDDAIMVLENIVRHREKGASQQTAALKGSEEISMAAIVATTAIMAIFIPVAFMKGIIGKFFFQFGVTMAVAVFLSLIEALSFAPMRCSQFLETGDSKNPWVRKFNAGIKNLTLQYSVWLDYFLERKGKVLLLSTAFFIGSLFLLPLVRKEFVPAQDQSMFLARLKLPIGSSIENTSQTFKKAEKLLAEHPSIRRYMSAVGGFEGGEVNTGNLFITLKKPGERPKEGLFSHRPTQEDLMAYFRNEFNKIPNVKTVIQDLSMRGFAAQRGFPVEFSVRGPDYDKLVEYSEKIQTAMIKTGLFQDVDSDYLEGMPEVRIYPDRDKAFQQGVSVESIAKTVNALIAGQRIAKYNRGGRRYDVRIKIIPEQRTSAEQLKKLFVRNNRGEMVQLADLVKIQERMSLLSIKRKGRERSIGVFANIAPKKSQADCLKKAEELGRKILPEGYHLVLSGSSETFRESFQSLLFALLLGILISYMVLAAQFNHLIHPFTVLLAMPFSVSGAIIALLITGHSLNIFSLIGLLLLMGVVKKNSILIVEFSNQLREQGLKPLEAVRSACPIRLRPILMTSVSTIAAAIPPALALGPGAETRIPMAIAVIGGMIVSTILSLIVVPCAYLALVPYEQKWAWLRMFAFWKKKAGPKITQAADSLQNLLPQKKP